MIAKEYMKSLKAESPKTFQQLKLEHDSMFAEIQKVEISRGNSKSKNKAFSNRHNNNREESMSRTRENFEKADLQPARATKKILEKAGEQNNEDAPQETDEKRSNTHTMYKIKGIWNPPQDEPEQDFILGGYFKVLDPPDVFWVNAIKKVDGRLSGYYKEYGGCSGWVNLEYFDGTDVEGHKESETLKRKRKKFESSSWESEYE